MPRPIVQPEINQPSHRAPLIVSRDPNRESYNLLFGGYDPYTKHHQQGVINQAGLMRQDCNITHRVLRQPWNDDFFRHSWDDINDGRRELFSTIEQLNPSVIVATGAEAAYDLVPNWRTLTDRPPKENNTGGANIKTAKAASDRRGYFFYDHDLPTDAPVLVTLDPASCLYQAMPNRLLLDIDMQRLGAHLRGELVRREWPVPIRITNAADLEPLWDSIHPVAYDIEVTWGGAKFLCIGFYTREGQALLAYGDALGACEDWLLSDRAKLCHNGQFDRYFLETISGIKPGGRHEDTIVGHWACYPELAGKSETGREDGRKKSTSTGTRKGLNFLGSFHLDVEWWKVYTSDFDHMGQLCVNDVAATQWCWEIVEPEVDAMHVRVQYERQIAKIGPLIAVQKRGFLIDEDMRAEREQALTDRKDELGGLSHDAGLAFLQAHDITHHEDGTEHLWYHDAQCTCCNGGKFCKTCSGVRPTGANGSIKKADAIIAAWRSRSITVEKQDLDHMKKDDILALFPPCKTCEGTGKVAQWDFNPMSGPQMKTLLFDYLEVPKYCYTGAEPNAAEDTLKKALEWAEG